jgi:hypothetical protein
MDKGIQMAKPRGWVQLNEILISKEIFVCLDNLSVLA